jgi:ZPR1 zinc finger protein
MDPLFELRPTTCFSVYCLKTQPAFQHTSFNVQTQSKLRQGWIDFNPSITAVKVSNLKNKAIPFVCPACGVEGGSQRSCNTNIPHFQDITILSFVCEHCGFKTNEVKADSGTVSKFGMKWTLHVTDPSDMHRDLIKSKTARVCIPELGFEMVSGSLGGLYTTVEGLLKQIHDRLSKANPLDRGDASTTTQRSNFKVFLSSIHDYRSGHEPFTIVMEDPMDQSFIYSTATEDRHDTQLTQTTYVRTKEEDEECGVIDPSFRDFDPEYIANLQSQGDPLPKPSDWEYTNDDDLTHNRFANFEEALLQSIGRDAAADFMCTNQPWEGRAHDTDFGVVDATATGEDY